MDIQELVFKYTLQNAVFYKGKADPNAVLGKIMAGEPGLRAKINEIKKLIEKAVAEVNRMSPEEQKASLDEVAPELLERTEIKQEELPPLQEAVHGKVVTRFAPAPTGPLTLSHLLRAVFLSYLYAKKYEGKFVLRFEDTDPSKVKKEFYEWIQEDLKSAGVKWDRLVIESNNMEHYYRHAEELIKKSEVYACFCSAEQFKKLKEKKQNCPHRDSNDSLKAWRDALAGKYEEGKVVFRLKTSMKDPNPAIRDPPIMRISKETHPLQKRKYNLWPLYNYANVIEDHLSGITHVFRGKEHEHNTAIQRIIYQKLDWEMPIVINFGMVYLPEAKLHKRDIRKMIEKKEISGWDDPRLPTVRAFVRRGFQPEAFRQAAIACGLTKTDIKFNIDTLYSMNRKLIDADANRYMVVTSPVKISIRKAPLVKEVHEDLHPDYNERGKKVLPVDPEEIYISREDFSGLMNKEFRLKGFGNIILQDSIGKYTGNELDREMQKVQWVSTPNVPVRIIRPDGILNGLGEVNLRKLKPGQLIQMERIGFGRVEKIGKEIEIVFAHR